MLLTVPSRSCRLFAFMFGLLVAIASRPVQAEVEPPGRVGRLADFEGEVLMYDQEQGRWAAALRNRPLTSGDRLSVGPGGRAEVRVGSTTLRLAASTEIDLVRVDDQRIRVELLAGSLALRVRSREVAAEVEVSTREARLQPLRSGHFRIDRFDDTTAIGSWRGEIRIEGPEGFVVDTGRRVEVWQEGPSRRLHHSWTATADDEFAAWVAREDRIDQQGLALRHVSPEMTGIEDLDRHGRWEQHPEYGVVWSPLQVSAGWAPYRHGHWAWVRPWGWTWVDDARWGFAPFHYGRWIHWRSRWCWVPGPVMSRPVFSPGLVAWIGGPGFGVSIGIGGGSIGWVPLTPFEVYVPWYVVGPRHRDYHSRPYTPSRHDHPRPVQSGPVLYGNQGVPGGITVVPASVLAQRQLVEVRRHELRDEAVVREVKHQPATRVAPPLLYDQNLVGPPPVRTGPEGSNPGRPRPGASDGPAYRIARPAADQLPAGPTPTPLPKLDRPPAPAAIAPASPEHRPVLRPESSPTMSPPFGSPSGGPIPAPERPRPVPGTPSRAATPSPSPLPQMPGSTPPGRPFHPSTGASDPARALSPGHVPRAQVPAVQVPQPKAPQTQPPQAQVPQAQVPQARPPQAVATPLPALGPKPAPAKDKDRDLKEEKRPRPGDRQQHQ